MAQYSTRILMAFHYLVDDTQTINAKLKQYQHLIAEDRSSGRPLSRYFVLVVSPNMPHNTLRTPDIARLAENDLEEARQLLVDLGRQLGIQESHRLLAQGYGNMQVRYFARVLKIDTVLGYTKNTPRLLKWMTAINHHAWLRAVFKKKLTLQEVSNESF